MNRSEKKNHLVSLKSEVTELHPLLDGLFRNLPHINAVEYTHGNAEMGADFVLLKSDPTLKTSIYIGVIAKRGKIDQNNYQTVDRQLQEMKLERTFCGGKEKIFVTEVWIVSNENITQPAQRRVHHDHANSKVQFIPGEKLIDLIDEHFDIYWRKTSAELSAYLKELEYSIHDSESKLSLLTETPSSVFIQPDIRECDKDDYSLTKSRKNSPPKIIDLSIAVANENLILLEGEPGIGKSRLLRNLASRFINESSSDEPVLPVFFTFKEYADEHQQSLDGILQVKMGVNYEALMSLQKKKILLIIDGLDEYRDSKNRIPILKSLFDEILTRDAFSCIVASRHLDRHEITDDLLNKVYCVEIMPLKPAKIISFLKALTKNLLIPERILEDVRNSQLFRDLPQSPIAAILLARLLKEDIKDLPASLPELYLQFIEVCVGRWEISKALQSQMEYKALNVILQKIAVYMMDNGLDRLNAQEALAFYEEYLENRPNYNIQPKKFFERTTERCPIICLIENNTVFMFKHRSFIEFYYARMMSIERNRDFMNQDALTAYWRNSVYFYIGLLESPDNDLLSFTKLQPIDELQRFTKFNNLADFLMAGYAADSKITIEGVKAATIEAARFYLDAVRNPKQSTLNEFSQIHLLWLTQFAFKNSFSYEFFKKWMDKVALTLIDEVEDKELLAVALFLLDVTHIHGTKEANFRFLQEYVKELPIAIRLGIHHESKGRKQGKFVKKVDKNFKERFRRDGQLRAKVLKAYENSIRSHVLL